jgi:kynurenine formamidase
VDSFDCDYFIGESEVIDFSNFGPGAAVNLEDVQGKVPTIQPGSGVILFFDWSKFYGDSDFYRKQPFLVENAANYLASLEPRFVGYDLPMPDNPSDGRESGCDSPIHKIFLSKGIPLIESLRIPAEHPTRIENICVPLNLEGLDGSPVRFLARGVPQND